MTPNLQTRGGNGADSRALPHLLGNEPIIAVRGLEAAYGNRYVLRGVDLDVYPGETMVILGASGSGKSTLLRHIEGLGKPSSGTIMVKGVDICSASRKELKNVRRAMGVSFQSAAMFNSMTVGDNVALPLREPHQPGGTDDPADDQDEAAASGPQRRRRPLPLATLGRHEKTGVGCPARWRWTPEILLFDEPSAGLDPIIAAGIDELILHLKKAFKMTIVIVTHEMQSAYLIADRMCMLYQGEILAVGTVDEIRNHRHPHIRRFVDRAPRTGSIKAITVT